MRKLLRKMSQAASQAVRKATKPEEFGLARKLAVLHREGYVREGDQLVEEFASALKKLAEAAGVTELRAADTCVHTHKLIAGRRTLLQVVTEMGDAVPPEGLKGVSIQELAAGYQLLVLYSSPPKN